MLEILSEHREHVCFLIKRESLVKQSFPSELVTQAGHASLRKCVTEGLEMQEALLLGLPWHSLKSQAAHSNSHSLLSSSKRGNNCLIQLLKPYNSDEVTVMTNRCSVYCHTIERCKGKCKFTLAPNQELGHSYLGLSDL